MGSPRTPSKRSRVLGTIVAVVVVLVAGYYGIDLTGEAPAPAPSSPPLSSGGASARPASAGSGAGGASVANETLSIDASEVVAAMNARRSDVMVSVTAEVVRVLGDDNEGSRHQRFLLGIDDEGATHGTVLVAHNIDLAERVPLDEGDVVRVRGEYEWNEKGGVIHWTHHDPKGWREGGWIELGGERYE